MQSGAGSGVIISQDGYILTCAHGVSGATSVKVQLDNGDTYDATIVGSVSDAATAQQLGVTSTGVYVVEVTAGGGAEAAGVQAGDRIIAVDDTALSTAAIIRPRVQPEESPRQCRPAMLVSRSVSILTLLE